MNNTYEIFSKTLSKLIESETLLEAVKIFQENNPKEEVIFAENIYYMDLNDELKDT